METMAFQAPARSLQHGAPAKPMEKQKGFHQKPVFLGAKTGFLMFFFVFLMVFSGFYWFLMVFFDG